MKKIIAISMLLALAACGSGTIVKDSDLQAHLQKMSYTKVMLMPKRLDCGRYGRGKHFIGTRKDGAKILGQICYRKASDHIEYKVDINKVNPGKIDIDGTPFSKGK